MGQEKSKIENRKSQINIETLRHSLSHVLAAAVLDMFPEAKLGMGPAIENGFYYDFDLPRTLIPEDLPILEEKMQDLLKQGLKFEKAEVLIEKAIAESKKSKQTYKTELLSDLKKSGEKKVSFYKIGNFIDLCAGPHIKNTSEIDPKAFKLTSIAGAYWKGDEKNKMLQRIYGVAFEDKKQLDEYLKMKEEAKKRDHRKLGKELDLYVTSDLVGPGLPLFTPKGTIILDELQKHIEAIGRKHGFQKVSAPGLAKIDLFDISGHKQKFGDELFHVKSHHKQNYVLKPVQCPHHIQIYASKIRSYRDLPIRYMESGKQFRDEKPGEISGLSRVIAITVEDGHTFCRVDQVKTEIKTLVKAIRDFYKALGLWDSFWVSLSVKDKKHPEQYIGEPKDWDECEKILQEVSDEMKLNAKRREGEAALYGPKLDFMFKDAMGREIQIPTVQIDFATPKRFNLTYINQKGAEENPVMVHRAILGSYERFMVMILEHFAGALPTWLTPVQVNVITVGASAKKFAKEVNQMLLDSSIRSELKDENETVGKKIRDAELQKIPYMLVVGDKEVKSKSVAVRKLKDKKITTVKFDKFLKDLQKEIEDKK